jgi:hypothetical protein
VSLATSIADVSFTMHPERRFAEAMPGTATSRLLHPSPAPHRPFALPFSGDPALSRPRRLSSRDARALADALPPSEKAGSRRQEPAEGMMPRRYRCGA